MTKLLALLLALAFSATALLEVAKPGLTPATARAGEAEKTAIEAPVFAVDDSWEYQRADGSRDVTRIVELLPDGGSVTIRDSEPKTRFVKDKHLVNRKIEGEFSGDPRRYMGWQFIDFPMAPGKKFSYSVKGSIAPFEMEVRGVKWENITVPAGAFEALKIDVCYYNVTSRWRGCGQTHWYAPQAKAFIKRRTPAGWAQALLATDFELVRFTLASPSK